MGTPGAGGALAQWLQDAYITEISGEHYLAQSNHVTVAVPLPRLRRLWAMRTVYETPELMEKILLLLSDIELLYARQVCRHWRDIVHGSKRLTSKLFITEDFIGRSLSEATIIPYTNLGMTIHLDTSRPCLFIKFSWQHYLSNPRTEMLHRGSERSDFLRSICISRPSPVDLVAYHIRSQPSFRAILNCYCTRAIYPMKTPRALFFLRTRPNYGHTGMTHSFSRLPTDVIHRSATLTIG